MARSLRVALLALLSLLLAACGITIPTDPDGTLDRVRGGTLRVGVSPHEPWTATAATPAGEEPSGIEPELVQSFAEHLGADVAWELGGEEALIGRLERGELDLVIGGLTVSSPWSSRAALTLAYTTVPGPDGSPTGHVMAAPMGENAFLVELEHHLLAEVGR